MIVKHLPILQVLLPLSGALFSGFSLNRKMAMVLSVGFTLCACLLSIYGLFYVKINTTVSYFLGDWLPPIGIEYKLDFLNQPIIVYSNICLLFNLVFCHKLFHNTVVSSVKDNRQNLVYAILLCAHTGYVGILSTNDLFNLYVFIEIASISSCILIAQGNNPRAVLGSFDYLILGTIGATLILIGIGLLFSKTGSLNIPDIKRHLTQDMYHSSTVITGAAFFIIGCTLKMAFFPMHFWMIRAYQGAPSVILTYLAGISGVIGAYLFLRFVNFVLDYNQIQSKLSMFLTPLGVSTMILCSLCALKSENLKKIIVYSSAAQMGYVVLLLAIGNNYTLVLQFLMIDGINKIAIFLIIAYLEDASVDLNLKNIKSISSHNQLLRIIVGLNIICSSALPISNIFFMKINIIDLLIKNNLFFSLVIVIITSSIALLYHYKIAKALLMNNTESLVFKGQFYNLIFITVVQLLGYGLYQIIF